MELIYRIINVYDKNGNKKELPHNEQSKRWMIEGAYVGNIAILIEVDSPYRTFFTSKVEDISIYENTIRITTKNYVYWLKPYVEVLE